MERERRGLQEGAILGRVEKRTEKGLEPRKKRKVEASDPIIMEPEQNRNYCSLPTAVNKLKLN